MHANGPLYVEPDNLLTFQSSVTAVGNVLFQRNPLDTRNPPAGAGDLPGAAHSGQPALTLPIGATNTPASGPGDHRAAASPRKTPLRPSAG